MLTDWTLDISMAFMCQCQFASPHMTHELRAMKPAAQGHGSGLLIFFGVLVFFVIESTVHRLSASSHHNQSPSKVSPALPSLPGNEQDPASSSSLSSTSHHDTTRRRQRPQSAPSSALNTDLGAPSSKGAMIGNLLTCIRQRWPDWLSLPAGTHPMAYLNLLADGVHNFTDGIALSSAFLSGGHTAGWRRTLIVLVHELPQEIGDFGVLVSSCLTPRQALGWNLASAGTAVLGAACVPLVDVFMQSSSGAGSLGVSWLSGLEALTAGGFLWIAIGDVLPVLATKPHLLRNIGWLLAGLMFCLLAELVAH